MRTYRLTHRVSHAHVDFLGELKVSALLGLLEQAAVEASTDAGFDPAWYTAAGRMWVVRHTRLDRRVPVGGSDALAVTTRIADFRRARSLRRYVVEHAGVTAATATTDWVFCDLRSGRPARIPEDVQLAFGDGARAPTLPRPPHLPAAGPGEPSREEVAVAPTHLDHIVHVNNAVYADFLENAAFACFAARGWPLPRMLEAGGALRIDTLDAEYHREAGLGDRLTVTTWVEEADADTGRPPRRATLLQAVTRADGSAVLRARTVWSWRARPAVVGGVPGRS